MALSQTTSPTALADELVVVTGVSATSINNVTASTSGKVYILEADNTSNEYPVYLKIADAASATAGVTQAQFRIRIPKGEKVVFSLLTGHPYTAGLSLWATTSALFSDTTIPENPITVKLIVTA